MPVTRGASVLSSAFGPAKWAAVLALGTAAGAGVTYGLLRPGAPAVVTPAPVVLPPESTGPASPPSGPSVGLSTGAATDRGAGVGMPDLAALMATGRPAFQPKSELLAASDQRKPLGAQEDAPGAGGSGGGGGTASGGGLKESKPTPPAPQPAVSKPAPGPAPAAGGAKPTTKQPPSAPGARTININTAPQAELELLPGIGPALAKRILDYRTEHGPFKTVDELDKVKGIGVKTLARLRPMVTVS